MNDPINAPTGPGNYGILLITEQDRTAFATIEPPYHSPAQRPFCPAFDPEDCGGVWDGFQVTSDADPGL